MRVLGILIIIIAIGCQPRVSDHAFEAYHTDDHFTISELSREKKGVLMLFLSPSCPLCKNYAPTFRSLDSLASSLNIEMVGVISGVFHPDTSVTRYLRDYGIHFPILKDPEMLLAQRYKATITPEAVLIDPAFRAKYQGAIDNWAISLGRKRPVISAHYLRDALAAFANGEPIEPKTTLAVGCYIE